MAPLDITLTISGSFGITNSELYYSGPADIELTAAPTTTEYQLRFPVEGVYTLTAYVTGPDEQEYEAEMTITVQSKLGLERLLKQKWERMKAKVAAIDVEGAVSLLASSAQAHHRDVFTAFGPRLPVLAEDLPSVQLVYITDEWAKCRIVREELVLGQIKTVAYPVYYVKENGIWKLTSY